MVGRAGDAAAAPNVALEHPVSAVAPKAIPLAMKANNEVGFESGLRIF
jgi:hypothetical protein